MPTANRIAFQNIPIETPDALSALRASGKLLFDQMPLLELGGLNLSQSSALIRHLARRGDLYGDGDREALWRDMIAGAVGDSVAIAIQAAFQPTTEIVIAAMQARVAKFGPGFEACLASNGGDFCVGNRLSFADIVLVEAFIAYVEWLPDLLAELPGLRAFKIACSSTAYLGSEQRYPKANGDYVIAAAMVLQRARPPHMPDANRFVVRAGRIKAYPGGYVARKLSTTNVENLAAYRRSRPLK